MSRRLARGRLGSSPLGKQKFRQPTRLFIPRLQVTLVRPLLCCVLGRCILEWRGRERERGSWNFRVIVRASYHAFRRKGATRSRRSADREGRISRTTTFAKIVSRNARTTPRCAILTRCCCARGVSRRTRSLSMETDAILIAKFDEPRERERERSSRPASPLYTLALRMQDALFRCS